MSTTTVKALSKHAMNSLLLFVFAFACSEKKLGPDDVEYRKDENGSQILYEIGAKEPFGTGKEAFVVGKHPNGKKHFEISSDPELYLFFCFGCNVELYICIVSLKSTESQLMHR